MKQTRHFAIMSFIMKKAMTIIYPEYDGLYINLTNRCPCACTFCIRQKNEKFYTQDSLWLEHEPSFEEVKAALLAEDLEKYSEFVFCGFGEPVEALDVLLETARFLKSKTSKPVRINTNGLGNLIHNKDITPLFKGLIDALSISLNSSDPDIYTINCRPKFGKKAHEAMLDFARKAVQYVPEVTMTTVSTTITHEDEKACAELCKQIGANYRNRELIS